MRSLVWAGRSVMAISAALVFLYSHAHALDEQSCDEKRDFAMFYQFTRINQGGVVPELDQLGLRYLKISYEGRFGIRRDRGLSLKERSAIPVPALDEIQRAADRIQGDGDLIPRAWTVIDIEAWLVDSRLSDNAALEGRDNYIQLIDALRSAMPGRRLGNYGLPVHRDYAAVDAGEGSQRFQAWRNRNSLMQPLADSLDVFHPSLYVFSYEKIDQWERYATAHISESRRLANRGQLVVPFIWPRYHDRSRNAGVSIGGEFWSRKLALLMREADGVFIWSNQPQISDADGPWMKATLRAIQDAKAQGRTVNQCVAPLSIGHSNSP